MEHECETVQSLAVDRITFEELSGLDADQLHKFESVAIQEFFRANALGLKQITDADERQLARLQSPAMQELIANKEITPSQVLNLLDHAPFELLAIRDLIADRFLSVERTNLLSNWAAGKIARLSSRKLVNLMLAENSGIAHANPDPTDFLDDHFCAMQAEAARIFDYEGPSLRGGKEDYDFTFGFKYAIEQGFVSSYIPFAGHIVASDSLWLSHHDLLHVPPDRIAVDLTGCDGLYGYSELQQSWLSCDAAVELMKVGMLTLEQAADLNLGQRDMLMHEPTRVLVINGVVTVKEVMEADYSQQRALRSGPLRKIIGAKFHNDSHLKYARDLAEETSIEESMKITLTRYNARMELIGCDNLTQFAGLNDRQLAVLENKFVVELICNGLFCVVDVKTLSRFQMRCIQQSSSADQVRHILQKKSLPAAGYDAHCSDTFEVWHKIALRNPFIEALIANGDISQEFILDLGPMQLAWLYSQEVSDLYFAKKLSVEKALQLNVGQREMLRHQPIRTAIVKDVLTLDQVCNADFWQQEAMQDPNLSEILFGFIERRLISFSAISTWTWDLRKLLTNEFVVRDLKRGKLQLDVVMRLSCENLARLEVVEIRNLYYCGAISLEQILTMSLAQYLAVVENKRSFYRLWDHEIKIADLPEFKHEPVLDLKKTATPDLKEESDRKKFRLDDMNQV